MSTWNIAEKKPLHNDPPRTGPDNVSEPLCNDTTENHSQLFTKDSGWLSFLSPLLKVYPVHSSTVQGTLLFIPYQRICIPQLP